ncbi:Tautomerase/MIF superfamily [Crepidotus variabilis]|uniref:L-dopachrome isomerase n=1 Tax=Crepidotus variabilis TaxID=179855 RepID=A0A9P6E3U7_9AGAR|nr:Tautomerase/MIF superfamily [Crepidotus variabilis]
MPFISLTTNVQIKDLKSLNLELSKSLIIKLSSETLGLPEALVSVHVIQNESLSFGGTSDPAFSLKIGTISTEANIKYTEAYSAFLKEKLSISNDRGFIFFVDVGKTNIGFKGTTVAVLQGASVTNTKPE